MKKLLLIMLMGLVLVSSVSAVVKIGEEAFDVENLDKTCYALDSNVILIGWITAFVFVVLFIAVTIWAMKLDRKHAKR